MTSTPQFDFGNSRDEPLSSDDLSVCSLVLDEIRDELKIEDELIVRRIGKTIIELWRQGVHEPARLKMLAKSTRE